MSSVLGRERYDAQFKRDAVRLVLEGKRSCRAVEADLGLGTGVLYRWVRQYRADPQQSLAFTSSVSDRTVATIPSSA